MRADKSIHYVAVPVWSDFDGFVAEYFRQTVLSPCRAPFYRIRDYSIYVRINPCPVLVAVWLVGDCVLSWLEGLSTNGVICNSN